MLTRREEFESYLCHINPPCTCAPAYCCARRCAARALLIKKGRLPVYHTRLWDTALQARHTTFGSKDAAHNCSYIKAHMQPSRLSVAAKREMRQM